MPASGARSGTRPSRNDGRGAGDGRIMVRISLRCGHGVPREQEPVVVQGSRRWFSCPDCHKISEPVRS